MGEGIHVSSGGGWVRESMCQVEVGGRVRDPCIVGVGGVGEGIHVTSRGGWAGEGIHVSSGGG